MIDGPLPQDVGRFPDDLNARENAGDRSDKSAGSVLDSPPLPDADLAVLGA